MPDDEDLDDDSQTDLPAEAEELPKAARRPTEADREPLTVYGRIPARCDTWGMDRRTELGAWEKMTYPTPDGRLRVAEWLPAELSQAEVEKRWGPGTYRASWFGQAPQGGRRRLGGGREFTILPREVAPASVTPVVDDPVMAGLERAFRLQAILDGRAQAQLQTQAQMMQMMLGMGGGGASAEVTMLRAELERSRQAASDAQIAALRNELAQLRSELVDETPVEPGAVQQAAGAVVKAGARRVFSNRPIGESLQGAISAWVAEDPIAAAGQIVEVVKTIPNALEALSGLLGKVTPAAAPAQLAPAAPMPPARVVSAPPPPSPGDFAPAKPRAVRAVPTPTNGATPPPSPLASIGNAPTEPPSPA